jgi:hypothetical protein
MNNTCNCVRKMAAGEAAVCPARKSETGTLAGPLVTLATQLVRPLQAALATFSTKSEKGSSQKLLGGKKWGGQRIRGKKFTTHSTHRYGWVTAKRYTQPNTTVGPRNWTTNKISQLFFAFTP